MRYLSAGFLAKYTSVLHDVTHLNRLTPLGSNRLKYQIYRTVSFRPDEEWLSRSVVTTKNALVVCELCHLLRAVSEKTG